MTETKPNKEVHELAGFVHGTLSSLHLLGLVYNARRKNWWDVLAHSLAMVYSIRSAVHHQHKAREAHE